MRDIWTVLALVFVLIMLSWPAAAQAEEDSSSLWPLRPGVALKTGAGWYRSVPCRCVDRKVWNMEFVGRLHFGWRAALEADLRYGSMLLGGRFPSEGWAVGARVALFEPQDRWWDGLHMRAGFRQWRVMGMRADGSPGGYGAVNWEFEILSHLYLETDVVLGRTFRDMQHWYLMGMVGVSTRF